MNAPHELPEADTGAPITLITGLPGAGKTLFALAEFAVGKAKVFQRGIPGCTLPEWDPEKWADLAPGSTLIVDEAREVYPPKSPTSEPPAHYKLHRIRHTGVALVIIAQHPNDIDARVRRLVRRHVHLVDVFGLEEAVVHEWNEVRDPDAAARAESVSKRWKYPRQVYSLYKSSTQHRRESRVPLRVRLIPVLWVAAAAAALAGPAWLYWLYVGKKDAPAVASVARPSSPVELAAGAPSRVMGTRGPGGPAGSDGGLSPEAWLAAQTPRVPGLPHTAPVYDSVTQPVVAPAPVACVASASRCKCYSQQATALEVPEALCRSIVAGGYFVAWSLDGQRVDRVPASAQAASAPAGARAPGAVAWHAGDYRYRPARAPVAEYR